MTILITVLLTLLAVILTAVVAILFAAPLRISFKMRQKTQIDIEFGRYMANVWSGIYWFSIIRLYYDQDGDREYAALLFYCFHASKEQIARDNAKVKLDNWRKEQEAMIEEYEWEEEYADLVDD